MKSSKLPAIQFYGGDWRKDIGVQSLSYHDRGVWFEILLLMHESERRGLLILNGRAMTEEELSRVLGLDKQITTTVINELLTSGVASREPESGALLSRRMVRDEQLRKIRSEAGKLGGNPLLLKKRAQNLDKQNQTTGDKQSPTPSLSSSASTPLSQAQEEKKRGVPPSALGGAGEQVAKSNRLKAGRTKTSARAMAAATHRNSVALGAKPTNVLSVAVERRAKWLHDEVKKFWGGQTGRPPDKTPLSDRDERAIAKTADDTIGMSEDELLRCFEHRNLSVVLGWLPASLQPSKWLRDLPSFLSGPLDKDGQLIPMVRGEYRRKGER